MPSYLQKGPTLSLPANKTTQTNVAFGLGNGSDVNFTVTPPTGFSYVYVSTIYRTDWQGTVALSPNPRTNICLRSEDLTTTWTTHNGTLTVTATTLEDIDAAVASARKQILTVTNDSVKRWFSVLVAKNAPNLVMVRFTLSGGTPTSTAIVFDTVTGLWGTNHDYGYEPLASDVIIKDLGAIGWSVSVGLLNNGTGNTTATAFLYPAFATTLASSGNTGIVNSLTGSAKFTKMQVEQSTLPTSYIPTTTVPVSVTDYTVSGLTYTLSETPLTGAILSYSGYSYTAAYATFDLPSCGSISISPSGLTSGKLRITASVDGTNFNPAVILPIDEATGVLAASSDLPNGFYTLNVKPFKSVRFTQTDVTDTVTISTALGR